MTSSMTPPSPFWARTPEPHLVFAEEAPPNTGTMNCTTQLLKELTASKQRQCDLERQADELRCQEEELWRKVGELGRIIDAIRADEEEATLPAGFTEGLDQMLEDPPSVKHGEALYFPLCSYGAHWGR
jgi:hypothetical protein